MRIGELLVMNGFITERQLGIALEEQQSSSAKLGEILVSNQAISERQLVEALEFQLGVPVVNMAEVPFDPAVVHLIPETIARKHQVLSAGRDGGKLRVAMHDPLDHEAIKQIQMVSGLQVLPMLATRTEIGESIIRFYGTDESTLAWNELLKAAIASKASGIDLEASEHGLTVRFRIGEMIQEHSRITKAKQQLLVERIKRLTGMPIDRSSLPQTGRYETIVDHTPLALRASSLPTHYGESFFLALSDPYTPPMKLHELDFIERDLKELEQALQQTGGMVIVAGPPGAGKTAVSHAMIDHKRPALRKIITLESPIAKVMPGITQVELKEASALTVDHTLRAALRHKPDLVWIDGLMDAASVATALPLARFGPPIIGTMTAKHAFDTLGRLMAVVRDKELLASSLHCIVAQRLVRRICKQCAQSVPANEEEMRQLEAEGLVNADTAKSSSKVKIGNFRSFIFTQMSGKPAVFRGNGCRTCGETGYQGIVAIQEVLTIDDEIKERIAEGKPIADIQRHAAQNGHKELLYNGLLKAREGLTTVEEVLKVLK